MIVFQDLWNWLIGIILTITILRLSKLERFVKEKVK